MLNTLLLAAFAVLVVLMVLWPRYVSALASLACLVGAALVMIYLHEHGLGMGADTRPAAPPRLPSQQR